MARTAFLSVAAGISALLTSTQVTAASGIVDQLGPTASSIVAIGWLILLTLLAIAIILPLVRH